LVKLQWGLFIMPWTKNSSDSGGGENVNERGRQKPCSKTGKKWGPGGGAMHTGNARPKTRA